MATELPPIPGLLVPGRGHEEEEEFGREERAGGPVNATMAIPGLSARGVALELAEGLDPHQRAAVGADRGPLLVVAGAGSGKTRVLTRRVAHAVRAWGLAPSEVLAISFTNKAVNEMQERLRALVGDVGAGQIACLTFHAAAWRLVVRPFGHALTYPRGAIFDTADSLRVVSQIIAGTPLVRTPGARGLLAEITRAKARGLAPKDLEARTELDRIVVAVWRRYRAELRAEMAVDFEDIMASAVWLLERHRDARDEVRGRFRAVLVDEYQDASPMQARFVRALAEEHGNLTACGDDDQAIYGFRGGDLEAMLSFESRWPGARQLLLPRNYRSGREIVEAAMRLVSHNAERAAKRIHAVRRGGRVRFWRAEDELAEAAGVHRALERALATGREPAEIAILSRAWRQLAALEERHLIGSAIPYRVAGGVRFPEHREIRDIVAFCRLAAGDGGDAAALARVIDRTQGLGIAAHGAIVRAARAQGRGVREILDAGGGAAALEGRRGEFAARLGERLGQIESARTDGGLAAAVELASHLSGWAEEITAEGGDPESERRRERLATLIEIAADQDARGDPSVLGLCERLTLADGEEDDGEEGAVTLSTIHAAKGLEWPLVCVVSAVEGRLPSWRAQTEAEIAEERRLAYVAFTRAQDELTVTAPARILRHEEGRQELREVPVSRFVGEAGIGA